MYALRICYVCHYCVCCGDTWASEIGTAFGNTPWLITTWKKVPAGTNGGVSPLGLLSSFLGGCFVALCFYVSSELIGTLQIFNSIFQAGIMGGCFGFVGSLVTNKLKKY